MHFTYNTYDALSLSFEKRVYSPYTQASQECTFEAVYGAHRFRGIVGLDLAGRLHIFVWTDFGHGRSGA